MVSEEVESTMTNNDRHYSNYFAIYRKTAKPASSSQIEP